MNSRTRISARSTLHFGILLGLLLPTAFPSLVAQDTWSLLHAAPKDRLFDRAVYDSARDRFVAVGGTIDGVIGTARLETWEWDEVRWRLVDAGTGPSAPGRRAKFSLAYDPSRSRVVLFGGFDGSRMLGDTWEWDGKSWSQVVPAGATAPLPRRGAAIAYDPTLGGLVLHGGLGRTSGGVFFPLVDTWTFDGATWTLLPVSGPVSETAAMTYEPGGSRLIWHGGNLTWKLDANGWAQISNTGPIVGIAQLTYDSAMGRVVLVDRDLGTLSETWTWDGATWTNLGISTPDHIFIGPVADTRRNRLLAMDRRSRIWTFDGTAWSDAELHPGGFASVSMAYNPVTRRSLMVNQLGELWAWDGRSWELLDTGLPQTVQNCLAFDSTRGRMIIGNEGSYPWAEWDGTGWRFIPRAQAHGLAFDSTRGQVIAYDGFGTTSAFDGTSWNTITTVASPTTQTGFVMASDPSRGRVVLFGGSGSGSGEGGTWEWDGNAWSLIATLGPSRRSRASMVYDGASGALVMFGGRDSFGRFSDTWSFDGIQWTQVQMSTPPSARDRHAMAYDAARNRMIICGGVSGRSQANNDVWEFGPFETIGTGCSGSTGQSGLTCPVGFPSIGSSFALEVEPVPSPNAWGLLGFTPFPRGVALDTIGMDGCFLYQPVAYSTPLPTSAGRASWQLAVPNNQTLAGTRVYLQSFVPDPSANPFGATTTNGGVITLRP